MPQFYISTPLTCICTSTGIIEADMRYHTGILSSVRMFAQHVLCMNILSCQHVLTPGYLGHCAS